MAQVLQLAHFVQHHGVANVDVGRGRVQAQFDAQRLARGFRTHQFFHPFVLGKQFFTTPTRHAQGVLNMRRQ